MKIQPRGKYILVEQDPEESRQNEFGIITPSNVEQEKKSIGTVVAVSDEIKTIKKGQRVIYGTYTGDEISFKDKKTHKEKKMLLLHDDDVLAFIHD